MPRNAGFIRQKRIQGGPLRDKSGVPLARLLPFCPLNAFLSEPFLIMCQGCQW